MKSTIKKEFKRRRKKKDQSENLQCIFPESRNKYIPHLGFSSWAYNFFVSTKIKHFFLKKILCRLQPTPKNTRNKSIKRRGWRGTKQISNNKIQNSDTIVTTATSASSKCLFSLLSLTFRYSIPPPLCMFLTISQMKLNKTKHR